MTNHQRDTVVCLAVGAVKSEGFGDGDGRWCGRTKCAELHCNMHSARDTVSRVTSDSSHGGAICQVRIG